MIFVDGPFAHTEAGPSLPGCGLVKPAVIICLPAGAEAPWGLMEALAFQSEWSSDFLKGVDLSQGPSLVPGIHPVLCVQCAASQWPVVSVS